MIGHVLGNYKVVEKIGEGGMGAVYRGIDLMLEREVAVKALRPELSSQPQIVERFRSEAVTLAKLNHPNVATLYSFFRQGNDYFMVMEFVRGVSLDHVISQRGSLAPEQAIPLFCQVLDGIDHAHRFGIIHRDIKPANMMLTDAGVLKVLDFGIARILGTARMTRQGHLIGTIEYMSPEQVRGQETDARSDIYSLGMLLYELLTGRVPFQFDNEFELMKAQVEQTPVPPSQLNPAIGEIVEQAITRAIAKNPADRFQSAGEFRALLLTAGYAAHGIATGPLAAGPSPYATTPLSNPPFSNPALSNPSFSNPALGNSPQSNPPVSGQAASYAPPHSHPSHPPAPPPSGEARAEYQSAPGVAGPQTGGELKETRLGAPMQSGDMPKETRLDTATAGAPFAPSPQHAAPPPPAQQSFFSRLTWVHYVGAGVAALFLLGAVIAAPLLLLTVGRKSPAPAPQAQEATPTPVAPQEQPAAAEPGAGQTLEAAAPPPAESSVPTADTTQSSDPNNTDAPAAGPTRTAADAPGRAAARPAPAAKKKPKADGAASAAAAEAARRKAALRALDQ